MYRVKKRDGKIVRLTSKKYQKQWKKLLTQWIEKAVIAF